MLYVSRSYRKITLHEILIAILRLTRSNNSVVDNMVNVIAQTFVLHFKLYCEQCFVWSHIFIRDI